MDLLAFGSSGWGDELLFGTLSTMGLAIAALPIGLMMGLGLGFARASPAVLYRLVGIPWRPCFAVCPSC